MTDMYSIEKEMMKQAEEFAKEKLNDSKKVWSFLSHEARIEFILYVMSREIERLRAEVKRLREALTDVLDGSSQWYEIQENTGLPEDRCKEIKSVYEEIMKEKDQ